MLADFTATIEQQVSQVLTNVQQVASLNDRHLLVVGASTSEVIGETIGTSGTVEVADAIFRAVTRFQQETHVRLAFQCCEHLNRALVVDRQTAEDQGYEQVSVVPVRSAGGAMAAYAYNQMDDVVVVESIKADAGVDIGDTFIGMHLKSVVVPVRCAVTSIGQAHVTAARTRPKLIGGERAIYPEKERIHRF